MALAWPYSASYLLRSASHSCNAAEKSVSLLGNLRLSKACLQTKLLEWLGSSCQSNLQNSRPFCSLICLAIFVATVNSCVNEYNIANSCLPRDSQSSVISTGSANVVRFRSCKTFCFGLLPVPPARWFRLSAQSPLDLVTQIQRCFQLCFQAGLEGGCTRGMPAAYSGGAANPDELLVAVVSPLRSSLAFCSSQYSVMGS